MTFLGLIAYDTWSVGVLVLGVVVVLVMTLQFIVYGVHQVSMPALHIWRTQAVSMVSVVEGFRGLRGEG